MVDRGGGHGLGGLMGLPGEVHSPQAALRPDHRGGEQQQVPPHHPLVDGQHEEAWAEPVPLGGPGPCPAQLRGLSRADKERFVNARSLLRLG